jgi:hypothetical protein
MGQRKFAILFCRNNPGSTKTSRSGRSFESRRRAAAVVVPAGRESLCILDTMILYSSDLRSPPGDCLVFVFR